VTDLNVTDTCFGFQIEVIIKKLIVDVKYCINLCNIARNLCTFLSLWGASAESGVQNGDERNCMAGRKENVRCE